MQGLGNGPISSLANALRSVGVHLDVADYKEHAIGEGTDVKAASYIECTTSGSNQKVWGVGIHVDVVQSSLIALLSAASNVYVPIPPYVAKLTYKIVCCKQTEHTIPAQGKPQFQREWACEDNKCYCDP